MTVRTLAEVAAYIDEHSNALPNQLAEIRFQAYLEISISILDSEFDNYPEGVLEAFLMAYLERKRRELDINL
ncbi:MAG: hypothetical protein JKX87_02655 [Cycloclasticus sp.]|nr:hypothetical protein [Cycloclasticus sp.]